MKNYKIGQFVEFGYYNETVFNKLYVAEKYFKNEDEMLCDIEKFKEIPNPIYTEIFNDIFGDG